MFIEVIQLPLEVVKVIETFFVGSITVIFIGINRKIINLKWYLNWKDFG